MIGMNAGDTRKLWAAPGTVLSQQLGSGDAVVFDVTVTAVDEYITLPDPLPGAPVGEATMEESDTGLAWYDLVEGEGGTPGPTDRVKVHYTGWLVNGEKFDSSKDRGTPFTVNMEGGVIQGWLEGLKTMQVGGTRKLVIPTDLAYGWRPRPGSPIPAGATLIFDVEMIEIIDPAAPPSLEGADPGGK